MAKKKTDDGKITKAEAVRRALADGVDQPADGIAYVKEKFGIEMTSQQFSTNKFQAKKKTDEAKEVAKLHVMTSARASRKPAPASGNGKATDLARSVKELIAAYGADEVRGMVEVLAE